MAINLSTLFLSIMDGAVSSGSCVDSAVMDALDLCNYSFIRRWDDMDYADASKVKEELREFYGVARDYNGVIPFPLRNYVKRALSEAGDNRASERQLAGHVKGEAGL